jgi:hypothetical protein
MMDCTNYPSQAETFFCAKLENPHTALLIIP